MQQAPCKLGQGCSKGDAETSPEWKRGGTAREAFISTTLTARQEWSAQWPLPLVSMLGVSGGAMFAYSSGVFMEDMTTAFGWSRAQFSSIFVAMMGLGLVLMPAVGWLTDRYGPRRLALIGIVPFAVCFSLLGLVSGSIVQWYALCLLFAPFQALVGQPIWIAAVIGRFDASRGMALAVTLSGLGLGSMLWPLLAALYIEEFGWRMSFAALALTWAVPVLPLAFAFFFGAPTQRTQAVARGAGLSSYRAALLSPTFAGLLLAAGLFASAYFGLTVHLVPVMRSSGLELTTAAGIASLVGLASITGRLGTGYLLDHLPTRPLAVVAFLMPALSATLLLLTPGSVGAAVVAVAILGLASGAEMDIVTYVAARRFGPQVFASTYAIFVSIVAACASLGPVLAGALFDRQKSYDTFLMIVIPLVAVGAGLMALLPMSEHRTGRAD
jgi:predicted MFS family arabinose efflux permease